MLRGMRKEASQAKIRMERNSLLSEAYPQEAAGLPAVKGEMPSTRRQSKEFILLNFRLIREDRQP